MKRAKQRSDFQRVVIKLNSDPRIEKLGRWYVRGRGILVFVLHGALTSDVRAMVEDVNSVCTALGIDASGRVSQD